MGGSGGGWMGRLRCGLLWTGALLRVEVLCLVLGLVGLCLYWGVVSEPSGLLFSWRGWVSCLQLGFGCICPGLSLRRASACSWRNNLRLLSGTNPCTVGIVQTTVSASLADGQRGQTLQVNRKDLASDSKDSERAGSSLFPVGRLCADVESCSDPHKMLSQRPPGGLPGRRW